MSSDTPITSLPDEGVRVVTVVRKTTDLFGREGRTQSWFEEISKAIEDPEDKPDQKSSQGVMLGEKMMPFNIDAAIAFKNQNPHHSTCIEAKARALIGLGFEDEEKISDALDPLCDTTFQDICNSIAEDYWQTGNGYMEVVRKGERIVGLHYIPAAQVRVCVEDSDNHIYYIVRGELGVDVKIMAPFGELQYLLDRINEVNKPAKRGRGRPRKDEDPYAAQTMYRTTYGTFSQRSEVIHFKRCTSMSRWYGFPDWLSAIANIELVQMLIQERFDFFQNRGVPEIMVFALGNKIDKETWRKIEVAMQATVGPANQHKSIAVNIADPLMKVQVEKLAMEGGKNSGEFSAMAETLALDIVSAHRTPPLLAGIQVSGKMGATNELPNALLAFQVLVIGPEQTTFQNTLGATLGNSKHNGGLALKRTDFKLKKITEEIPLGMGQQQPGETGTGVGAGATGGAKGIKALDTLGRMRTPAAASNGRDLSAGVKK